MASDTLDLEAYKRRLSGGSSGDVDLDAYKRRLAGRPVTPKQGLELIGASDPRLAPYAHAIAALGQPVLDVFEPQTPLTQRLFGPVETPQSRTADTILKLSPLLAGFGVGSAITRAGAPLLARAGGGILVDALSGLGGGAAGGAASAAVQEEPIAPAAVTGGLLGAGTGAGVGVLSNAGRRLAALWAARPGREAMPNIVDLDDAIPFVSPSQTVRQARAGAARAEFRRHIPEGHAPDLKRTNPALWARATAEARKAARSVAPGAKPDDLFEEQDFLQRLSDKAFKIDSPTHRRGVLDSARSLWGSYITRLGTTLRRDPDFGQWGGKFADLVARTVQLAEHFEGQMHQRVLRPIWAGANRADELGVDRFLHGEGGPVSATAAAIGKRWREIADDGFQQLSGQNVMEQVGDELVPLRRRTNYVPYYRDHNAVSRLTKPGKERDAFLQQIIARGEAETKEEAAKLLDDILTNDRASVPMHIRSGFQHERELTYGLPRERNARKWMERWAHDLSRRLASARVAGGQDEKVKELLKGMHEEGLHAGAERIERLWKSFIGRPGQDVQRVMPIARASRSLTAIQLLSPRTGLLQLLQLANPAARLGMKRTLEGMAGILRNPELRGAADEVGALLPSQQLMREDEPLDQLGEFWLKTVTQMPRGDRGARVISALASGVSARQWAKEYFELATGAGATSVPRTGVGGALKYVGIRNPAERMQILKRRLEETLGVPIERVMASEGNLGINDVVAAMRSGSHNTQFGASFLDLPEGRRTAVGQFLYQLRTFSKQQSTFFNKLVSDATKGDTGPITRYLLTYPALYAAAKPLLDFLSVKDAVDEADAETMEKVKSALHGALSTGMYGGMGDFINQMAASDPARAASHFLGPTIGQAIGIAGRDIPEALQGNFDPLVRRATPRALRPLLNLIQENQ